MSGAGDKAALPLIETASFRLRLAQAASNRHLTEALGELELTQMQLALLWLVADYPGISQIDLGQRLQLDRATTMGIVNRLQARRFLRREKSASDARKQALFLESAGEAALGAARAAVQQHHQWLESRFTAAELKTLGELLSRIAHHAPGD
ncbi:MAG: hypothetical protein RL268_605 [Pseudomonadota bacterium]|jgi:DNA-binding MarR family transcriptional regulator